VKGGIGNFASLSGVGEMMALSFWPDDEHASAVYFHTHPIFWVSAPAAKSFRFFPPASTKNIIFHFIFTTLLRLL
jgi:hypothetical protein